MHCHRNLQADQKSQLGNRSGDASSIPVANPSTGDERVPSALRAWSAGRPTRDPQLEVGADSPQRRRQPKRIRPVVATPCREASSLAPSVCVTLVRSGGMRPVLCPKHGGLRYRRIHRSPHERCASIPSSGKLIGKRLAICSGLHALAQRRSAPRGLLRSFQDTNGPTTLPFSSRSTPDIFFGTMSRSCLC